MMPDFVLFPVLERYGQTNTFELLLSPLFRYSSPCRLDQLGERAAWQQRRTAEGATPVTAQAKEPLGTGKSGERQLH